ncbi:hypothetical protein ABPG75_008714 [Micractinium tetrahymenae]
MQGGRWVGARPALAALLAGLALALTLCAPLAAADVSRPGGAGHALLFRDHGVVIENFKDLAPDALTFEAWLSTTDYCHRSAIFSYAIQSQSTDPFQRIADFNHFVIFDPSKVVGCHDFTYIDLWPDPREESCYAAYNHSDALPSFVERNGKWHHLAVVWTAADNGLMQIYWDGLLIVSTPSGKTRPLQPGGALMLGAEQDCYGGCTDRGQGFFGLLDEVRIWRTARSQIQILEGMRASSGLENNPDLAAYWQFNDPEQNGVYRETLVARDASGRGNDLHLVTLPSTNMQTIEQGDKRMETGALTFRNNYAMQQAYEGMPDRDITVEFWARTPAYTPKNSTPERYAEFFSFASFARDEASLASTVFLDDSILIEKYMEEFSGSHWLDYERMSTRGSISVHINANREGNGKRYDHWIDFAVGWLDNQWHHVAATWSWDSGEVKLYFDGQPKVPFWSSRAGVTQVVHPDRGGVDPHIAARTSRSSNGSLVLGQAHDCPGGCFSPQYSLHGDMANLRVWNRVLSREEVAAGMFATEPPNPQGLAAHYPFRPDTLEQTPDGKARLHDVHSSGANPLILGADAPLWVYSTAPLATPDGSPVQPPTAGSGGYAMFLSDQQVLIAKNMAMPPDEITVELWMRSTDTCRMGVPFSYAAPGSGYTKNDNAFLLFNYNSFGVAVMEDEGGLADHLSGISATDGRWHHIAVTWRSSDGQTKLYDNGVWSVIRGQGARITSGGTLVVGREQDCEGGCFDSDIGAAGSVQENWEQEYGAQDFFGTIDELRVWRKARTQQQIQQGMAGNLFRKGATGQPAGPAVDPHDPDLVAYWNFDEGKGWRVHDVTGHGHDLIATQEPRWEVVRHLAACGNGVLEGLEECDDGNTNTGDGCDATCKVESGWHCTRTSPSICAHAGERLPDVPAEPQGGTDTPAPAPGGGPAGPPGAGGSKQRGGKGLLIAGLVLAGVSMAGVALFTVREQIYDHFPQVETAVGALASRLPGRPPRYSGLPYDEWTEPGPHGSPASDFTATSPAPDRRGAATFLGYQALPAAAPPAPPQEQA